MLGLQIVAMIQERHLTCYYQSNLRRDDAVPLEHPYAWRWMQYRCRSRHHSRFHAHRHEDPWCSADLEEPESVEVAVEDEAMLLDCLAQVVVADLLSYQRWQIGVHRHRNMSFVCLLAIVEVWAERLER